MAQFQYKARDKEGNILTGTAAASDRNAMQKALKKDGLTPIAVMQVGGAPGAALKGGAKKGSPKKGKSILNVNLWGKIVKDEEILTFARDLQSLVDAGLPLVVGIQDIAEQTKNANFRTILEEISEDINTGSQLSEAFIKHPKIFSTFFINSVAAGERAGRLAEVLARVVETLDRDLDTTTRVKNTLRYPTIVFFFLLAAFGMIVGVVIPKISGLYDRAGVVLPLPSRIIIGFGDLCQNHGFLVLMGIVGFAMAIRFYINTKKGRLRWDTIKLYLPVFGDLFKKVSLAKFLTTLRTLYTSGVLLPDALQVCAQVVDNAYISKIVLEASERVRGGGDTLSDSLEKYKIFPSMVIRIVMMGEKAGTLGQGLEQVIKHYDREIINITRWLPTLIEPLLTVAFGFMILILALGVFLPMWQVASLFQ